MLHALVTVVQEVAADGATQGIGLIGAGLAIVNREETPLDSLADVVVHREIGPTMSYVVGIN